MHPAPRKASVVDGLAGVRGEVQTFRVLSQGETHSQCGGSQVLRFVDDDYVVTVVGKLCSQKLLCLQAVEVPCVQALGLQDGQVSLVELPQGVTHGPVEADAPTCTVFLQVDRKSTRLNSSHVKI